MTATPDITPSPSFHRHVVEGPPDQCWEWRGPLSRAGYGISRVKEGGRWRTACGHQIAYFLATGRWERMADGRMVRHLCHNPKCCNPRHLRGGTHADNAADDVARRAGLSLLPPKVRGCPVAPGVFAGAALEDWRESSRRWPPERAGGRP